MKSQFKLSLKFTSLVTLFFFLWSFAGLRDIAMAAQNGIDTPAASKDQKHQGYAQRKHRPEEKIEKATEEVEKIVKGFQQKKNKGERKAEKDKLKNYRLEIETDNSELEKEFAATEQLLIEKNISPEKLKAHREFVKEYDKEYKELKNHLSAVEAATTDEDEDQKIGEFENYINRVKVEKKRPKIDFDHLPHRNAEPTKQKPRSKKEEFGGVQKANIFTPEQGFSMLHPGESLAEVGYQPITKNPPIRVASIGDLSGILPENQNDFSIQTPSQTTSQWDIPTEPLSDPIMLAAVSDLPTPEDLAETIDIQLTDAIRAKAAELEHNPLKIYEWVRNNIEFAPTWGSIQGADYCLQTELCNDIDTASLLIALLRASEIPARYVHGTMELPIEQAMNWAGDFTDPNAALQFMSAGGIPTGQVVEGGKITRAHFEHVWVEAWIDYIPSRGARHRTGQGDMWIPLDGSFKQYTYTQPLDIAGAVPFDAQGFVNQLTSTATINEQEGYVTGVDSAYVQQSMSDFQNQVESYITTNYPDATVGDILGTKTIKAENYPYLLGTLKYKRVVTGTKYHELPDNLRHRWNMNIAGVAPISYSASLPELAGKKITLSYSPATTADEAVIESYLPAPHPDGSPIDPSELPSSLPAYLINLKPELRIDGTIVATGGPVMMGIAEDLNMNFYAPAKGTFPVQNIIEAGEYAGIALDLGRISQQQISAIQTKLENTKTKLIAQDFTGLGKDDLLGDLLFATAQSYYAEYDVIDYVTSQNMKVANLRLPSEAMFSNDLVINRSFFTNRPLSVSPGGLVMDVDYNTVVARALDGSHDGMIEFMRSSGVTSSALEHAVPEQMFSTVDNPAEGISAVKALQIANDQGIPIYTIDQSNVDIVLPQLLVDSDVVTDIVNAVTAGKVVTVSRSNIDFNNWNGCGYIIFDSATGGGVYMISGGLNGAVLFILLLVVAFALLALSVAIGPIAFAIVSLLLPIYLSFVAWLATQASSKAKSCTTSIAISALFITLGIKAITSAFGFLRNVFGFYGSIDRIGRSCFGIGIAN